MIHKTKHYQYLNYYKNQNLLHEINGMSEIDQIYQGNKSIIIFFRDLTL